MAADGGMVRSQLTGSSSQFAGPGNRQEKTHIIPIEIQHVYFRTMDGFYFLYIHDFLNNTLPAANFMEREV